MRKRWIASILTVAMMLSVISPLSAYADDGDDVLFEDDCGYEDPYDDGADEEGIHYYTEEALSGSGDDIALASARTYTLDELRQKYPAGKYWNHAGSSTNNPEGYTSTACTDHYVKRADGTRGIGQYDNRYYGAHGWATQCAGYAQQVASCYAGSDPQTWTKRTGTAAVNDLKTGDVVRYLNDGHSIFITKVEGENVWFSDCNYGNRCIIRWDVKTTKSTIKKTFTNVRVCPVDPGPDTCSTQYAGWYKVKSSDGISVNSGHNFNSKVDEIANGKLVYVDKASGMGSGQVAHIHYQGQERYLAMNLLTKMTGDPVVAGSYAGDMLTRQIKVYGIAFDWDDTDKAVEICVETPNGERYTCTANKESTSIPQDYAAVTDKANPGVYHAFETEYFTLPEGGEQELKVIAYNVDNGQPVESLTIKAELMKLTNLSVKSMPSKTEYTVGDTLDTTGLVLNGHYEGTWHSVSLDKDVEITSGFTCTPTTLDTAGTQTITVNYDGQSTSFDVTVKEKEMPSPTPDDKDDNKTDPGNNPTKPDPDDTTTTKPDQNEDKLEKLEIKTPPTKTTYVSGDTIDTTGLVLKATYSRSGEKLITDGYRCSPSVVYVTGKREITVRYDGGETSFEIYVKDAPNNNTTKPNDTPKPDDTVTTPSDDGSGMAAAILLGGAVVVVGGIVMMAMAATPVEVRATAISSDHAVLVNAPVALLQGDRVVAQTVTDANGQFHFNVKKGSYTLRVTTTNAETGETVTRYAAISAPANGSVVTF